MSHSRFFLLQYGRMSSTIAIAIASSVSYPANSFQWVRQRPIRNICYSATEDTRRRRRNRRRKNEIIRCEEVKEKRGRKIRWSLDILTTANDIAEWADEIREKGMHQRRKLFTHDDWLKHRSSKRHVRHLVSSLSSIVVLSLVPPMCLVTSIAVVIATYNTAITAKWLPTFMPLLHSPTLPYELTAPALALLLVFRTEASYARYDEGRRTWTKVIGCTKDLARLAISWLSNPNYYPHHNHRYPSQNRITGLLCSYIMAFPLALKCHVIHGSDLRGELKSVLPKEDLAIVMASDHPPNCLIQLISVALGYLQIDECKRHALESHVTDLNESVSVCEKLMRSPIPLSYTRLTTRFLVLWHLALPVVLWDSCHWFVVPANLFSAISLFCIEEVGVLIEEPFPILALDKMCALLHENILEMVRMHSVIDGHLQDKINIASVSSPSAHLSSSPLQNSHAQYTNSRARVSHYSNDN